MKYFAKYLPVEGEIKENDRISLSKNNNLIGIPNGYSKEMAAFATKQNHKRVKLFLCSRDINWKQGDGKHILITDDKNLWGQIEDDSVVPIDVSHAYDNDTIVPLNDGEQAEKNTIFKVIGEISKEAIWVKEGDEFDRKDIQILQKPRFKDNWKDFPFDGKNRKTGKEQVVYPHSPSFGNYTWEILNPSSEQILIEIKCSNCNTFH